MSRYGVEAEADAGNANREFGFAVDARSHGCCCGIGPRLLQYMGQLTWARACIAQSSRLCTKSSAQNNVSNKDELAALSKPHRCLPGTKQVSRVLEH